MVARTVNIVVVGVGGQGLLTLSRILAEAAMARGLDALAAETHGLSQRGGTVIVHVRIGDEVHAPLIPLGGADYILSTELSETVRYLSYANRSTKVITNTKVILPALPGLVKPIEPREVLEWLRSKVGKGNLYTIEASDIAAELGAPQSTNMVMLGAATPFLKDVLGLGYLEKRVARVGRGKIRELNLEAFRRGISYVCERYGACL